MWESGLAPVLAPELPENSSPRSSVTKFTAQSPVCDPTEVSCAEGKCDVW